MGYKRGDYPTNPLAGVERNNAAERGWGPGWPNCQSERMRFVRYGEVSLNVRLELVDLVRVLMTATVETFGYQLRAGECWGFACRAIRDSDPPVASNHSWGLAVDLNAPRNPMSRTFTTDMPPDVVAMWADCGWFWGGYYGRVFDTMHFEYVRRPGDVARDLARALTYLVKEIDMADAATIEKKIDDLARVLGLRYNVDADRYQVAANWTAAEVARDAADAERDAEEMGVLAVILTEVRAIRQQLPAAAAQAAAKSAEAGRT